MKLIQLFAGAILSILSLVSQAQTTSIVYYHNDLLGSPIAATNEQGQVVWRENYRPYGERTKNEAAAQKERIFFTARHQDPDTGLMYMGARYYDPTIGRFLSTDPVRFQEENIHSFNRYAYANNNPYKYTDPDGNLPVLVVPLLIHGGRILAQRLVTFALTRGTQAAVTVTEVAAGDALGGTTLAVGAAATAKVAKEITLSRQLHGEAAQHAADAIRAGKPDILTIERSGANANRQSSTGSLEKVTGKHLDEYPPAMFKEGGAGASVRPISPRDNMSSGACIGNACRGLPDGSRVKIQVTD